MDEPLRGTPENPFPFGICEGDFRENGSEEDPRSRLLCTVKILGVLHHLEAIAVVDADVQTAADIEYVEMLDELDYAFGGDGAFETVIIQGQEYVLFLSPYRQ